jgi:hypothetical protein
MMGFASFLRLIKKRRYARAWLKSKRARFIQRNRARVFSAPCVCEFQHVTRTGGGTGPLALWRRDILGKFGAQLARCVVQLKATSNNRIFP